MTRSSEQPTDSATVDRDSLSIEALEELSAIRETLDRIREDIDWSLKNQRREQWLPVQLITSMPADPLAPDWAERLNRFTAADLPDSTASKHEPPQRHLDTSDTPASALDDETQFCCEAPDLQWTGHPQSPGVACQNCGYIVADCGSVVMQPSAQADPDPEPKEEQRNLFPAD